MPRICLYCGRNQPQGNDSSEMIVADREWFYERRRSTNLSPERFSSREKAIRSREGSTHSLVRRQRHSQGESSDDPYDAESRYYPRERSAVADRERSEDSSYRERERGPVGHAVRYYSDGHSADSYRERINDIDEDDYEHIKCPSDCPLRRPPEVSYDPALPLPSELPPLPRGEACKRLYSNIKEWQTRILILQPGPFGVDLTASLVVVDLIHSAGVVLHDAQERVEFITLSYTWGAQVFPRVLTINQVAYPITENLFAFLQRFRDESKAQYLWIDAVCINQLDVVEKATQVKNMLTIYEKAKEVVVWLGERASDTEVAVQFLRWAHARTKLFIEEERSDYEARELENVKHTPGCAELFTSVLRGIEDMCTRNWVRRIWVKQEIWAAADIHVYCGSLRLTWDEFTSGPYRHMSSEGTAGASRPNLPLQEAKCLVHLHRQHANSAFKLEKWLRASDWDCNVPVDNLVIQPCEIMRLLNESVDCQVTVPHDRIYALLSMGSRPRGDPDLHQDLNITISREPLSLRLDYRKSIGAVFHELALSIMHSAGPHAILVSDAVFNGCTDITIPSWTPDFRRAIHCELQANMHELAPEINTSRFMRRWLREFRQLNRDLESKTLSLRGLLLGEVIDLEVPFEPPCEKCLVDIDAPQSAHQSKPQLDRDGVIEIGHGPRSLHRKSLRPMSCHYYPYLGRATLNDAGFAEWTDPNTLPCLKDYLFALNAFAMPKDAQAGDYIVTVPLVATPLVLRRLAPDPDARFTFIGCAWLYKGMHSSERELWYKAMDEMMQGCPIQNPEDRIETFVIE